MEACPSNKQGTLGPHWKHDSNTQAPVQHAFRYVESLPCRAEMNATSIALLTHAVHRGHALQHASIVRSRQHTTAL